MNVDCFNGNGKTIDEDIYLNRYCDQKDNFFDSLHRTTSCTQNYQSMSTYNTDFKIDKNPYYNLNSNTENHGIGLFDSVFMRNESSGFKNFTLTGSLKTEIFSLGSTAAGEVVKKADGGLTDGKLHWLATGGVCGASPSASWCNFEKVTLSNLSVSGATQTGGLLGHSGLNGIAQKILVTECNAEELSVEITCSNATNDNDNKFRCALGGFVGKAKEGYVVIQGGTNGSTVKLKKFNAEQNRLNIVTGGLVAYAGAGCQAYNMTVMPADSLANTDTVITIGGSGVGMSGGIVGLMQPSKDMVIADGHTLRYYLQRTTNDDGDRISTYKTEKGSLPDGVKDFACIMISTADDTETTNLINQYIRLVTNTTDDYTKTSDYYDVDVKTCQLVKNEGTDNSEFKLITDESSEYYPASITLTKGTNGASGTFSMVKANADSTRTNTFTLIDVQFKDPLTADHLAAKEGGRCNRRTDS